MNGSMSAAMDWPELPKFVREALESQFKTPLVLQASFESIEDAAEMLLLLLGDATNLDRLKEWATVLNNWKESGVRAFKRQRSEQFASMQNLMKVHDDGGDVDLAEVFEENFRNSPSEVLALMKEQEKRRRKLKLDPQSHMEREEEERKRFALALAGVIQEAELPVCEQIEQMKDQNKAWERIFGSRRARTLRNRFRSWRSFCAWLHAAQSRVWPEDVAPLIDYVEERIWLGCGKSVPGDLQAALTILEDAGAKDDVKLSKNSIWVAHLKSWSVQLQSLHPERKRAPRFTVSILLALEVYLMEVRQPLYRRALAWVVLLLVWCCMRVDDIQNVDPSSLRLSSLGLTITLSKTKITGPGKRHGQVQGYIKRTISLSGYDCLKTGFDLWTGGEFTFPRDYFVMHPNADFTGIKKKYMKPADLANEIRSLLRVLGTPKSSSAGWRLNDMLPLVPQEVATYCSGHSARHVLPSICLALQVHREEQNFLGRWEINKGGSSDYSTTARHVVHRLHDLVVRALVTGDPMAYDENEDLEDLVSAAGPSGMRLKNRHRILVVKMGQGRALGGTYPLEVRDEAIAVDSEDPSSSKELLTALTSTVSVEKGKCPPGRYLVTVSRRTGFRRLHVTNLCHVSSMSVFKAEYFSSLKGIEFDAACKDCKVGLSDKTISESERQKESSSEGSSTSTDTEVSDGGSQAETARSLNGSPK